MSDELTEDQVNQIRRKLQTGHKLAAVKLYKDLTGSSLLTAKNNVERIEAGEGPTPGDVDSGLSPDVMDEILDALQRGKKLDAVKIYKSSSGKSLMESKEFIEGLMKELEIEEPGGIGCGSAALLLILIMLVCAGNVIQ